jgi:hypothetical protein
MTIRDRIASWFSTSSPATSERIPLNPIQLVLVESLASQYGWPSGMTTLTREQHDILVKDMPMFESLSFGNSGDSKISSQHVAAALASLYTKAKDTRRELIRDVDEVSNFYLVDVVVSQICDDALSPDVSTDEIFKLTSKNPKIKKELEFLERNFKLDRFVKEIAPEIIRYGEYTLSTVVKGGESKKVENKKLCESLEDPDDKKLFEASAPGLVQLNDNVDQTEVVAITKNTETAYYLNMVEKSHRVILKRQHKSEYVQFRLDHQRIRVDLHKEFTHLSPKQKEDISELPRFVRVGKSFIHTLIPKFKELELLEKLVPATKLSKLSQGTILGVQVPAGYDLQKGMEAAKSIESIINRKLAIEEDNGRISVESVLTSVGRTKVVPIFGDKGQTTVLDTTSDEPDNLSGDVKDLREVILDSIGVPHELVYKSDGDSKADVLKRYSRYLRKLKAVQSAVKDGLHQIASIHLGAKGIPFQREDIVVDFRNKLIELDNLDKLEFTDGSVSLLDNTRNFVDELMQSEQFGPHIEPDAFVVYLKEQLRILGLNDLILLKPKKPVLPPEGEETGDEVTGDDEEESDDPADGKSPLRQEPKGGGKSPLRQEPKGGGESPLRTGPTAAEGIDEQS